MVWFCSHEPLGNKILEGFRADDDIQWPTSRWYVFHNSLINYSALATMGMFGVHTKSILISLSKITDLPQSECLYHHLPCCAWIQIFLEKRGVFSIAVCRVWLQAQPSTARPFPQSSLAWGSVSANAVGSPDPSHKYVDNEHGRFAVTRDM